MSGNENWHDYYSKTLGGDGFDFALDKRVARKEVPPGMIFKYNEGANYYASLGYIANSLYTRENSGTMSTNLRVSFLLRNPSEGATNSDMHTNFATLTLSTSLKTEDSPVTIKGAFHFEVTNVDVVQIVPLDIALSAKVGTVIMFPRSRDLYMIMGHAPELPDGKAMLLRLTKTDDDETLKGSSITYNPFISTAPCGQMVGHVGSARLHHWVSNK